MSIHQNLELIKAVALHNAKEHGCNYNVILMNPDNGMFKEGSSTYEFVRDSYFDTERTNCILLHKTDDIIKKDELVVLGHVGYGRTQAMALHDKTFVIDNLNELLDMEFFSLLSIGFENIKVGDRVRWLYQISKWSKPTDEIVYIGGEPTGNKPSDRVRIDRIKNGKLVAGGYVRLDELYLINPLIFTK